jgi:uncharacterized membrane protein
MNAHLFIAHFPIALLVVGAGADLIGAAAGNPDLRRMAGTLLILGTLGALLSFMTGEGALLSALERIRPGDTALEVHTQWGAVGVWGLMIAGGLRVLWRNRLEGARGWIALAVALASAALVVMIGLSGTAIAHGG